MSTPASSERDASSRSGRRRGLGRLARWTVTLGLLALLATVVDLGELAAVLRSTDPAWFGVVLAVILADRIVMAGKWLPLLRVQAPDASFLPALKAYFASNFAGFFLPASIGGDVLRSVGVGRERGAVVEVGASVVVERILGLVGSGVIALLSLWIALRAGVPIGFLLPWALLAVVGGIAAAVVPFSRRAQTWLNRALAPFPDRWTSLATRFAAACHAYRAHRRTVLVVGFLSILEQFLPVLAFMAAALALQAEVSIEALIVGVPLMVFAARLPISISGFGVVEGSMVYLLGLFGVPAVEALSLTLVTRVAEILVYLPGALWWRELLGERREN